MPAMASKVGARSVLPARRVTCAAGCDARSADDEGHVDVGLVRRLLAGGHAVLTEVEPVVGREHDVRVVELLRRPQRVHEPRHATVEGLEGADPPAVEHVDGVRLHRIEQREVAHERR